MRILVIEDEKKIADFIRRGLREEGYTVEVAEDGETGYELAGTSDFDLILMDVMLPKIDGVTLTRKLREEGTRTPILMLTAKSALQDKVSGLDSGADDYLTKPFAFEELLARIRAILRKNSVQASPTRLQVGDLVLDLITHRVARAGQAVECSAREYALLEYLMRHAGEVVTRTMIAEHVWDVNFDTFTNVIDVYISYLRNKIDPPPRRKLIHTVRGRGYMLKAL